MPTKPFLDKRPDDQNCSSEVSENRFIRGKRRARRTLEVDVRTGRTASGREDIESELFFREGPRNGRFEESPERVRQGTRGGGGGDRAHVSNIHGDGYYHRGHEAARLGCVLFLNRFVVSRLQRRLPPFICSLYLLHVAVEEHARARGDDKSARNTPQRAFMSAISAAVSACIGVSCRFSPKFPAMRALARPFTPGARGRHAPFSRSSSIQGSTRPLPPSCPAVRAQAPKLAARRKPYDRIS